MEENDDQAPISAAESTAFSDLLFSLFEYAQRKIRPEIVGRSGRLKGGAAELKICGTDR